MEKKNLKYIAMVCFAIMAIWDIVDCFRYYFSFWDLLGTIGIILVVISLITSIQALSTVGFAMNAVIVLINFLRAYWGWFSAVSFLSLLLFVSMIAAFVLLMLASAKPKSAKTLGLVAAIFAVIRFASPLIMYHRLGSVENVVWGLLFIAGAMLFGLAVESAFQSGATNKSSAAQIHSASEQGKLEDGNVEKLMRLKSFLDDGVITQEEFDAKKKQLLGL